jgi:hypothetical protein
LKLIKARPPGTTRLLVRQLPTPKLTFADVVSDVVEVLVRLYSLPVHLQFVA